jgi:hypothetical protein
MDIGSWVRTNIVIPAVQQILLPQNLAAVAAAFKPVLAELVADAVTNVSNQVIASEAKVVATIGTQVAGVEQGLANDINAVGGSVNGIANNIGNLGNTLVASVTNAIKNWRPF